MVDECRKCGVLLDDGNWSPSSQKKHYYICKTCMLAAGRLWREKNPEKDRAAARRRTKENPEKARAKSEKDNRRRGVRPFNENKDCSSFLGIHIAEDVLCRMFNDVVRMPMNNPGYDFVCNKGKKIDSKSSCLRTDGSWKFGIRRNTTPDFFICLAFDDRTNLNPLYAWMLPAKEFNHLQCLSIRPGTINKFDDYKIDISKVVECCDIMKGENNV